MQQQPQIIEITIISAQDLKRSTPMILSSRIRSFVTLSTTSNATTNIDKNGTIYKTTVDDKGGVNPMWGDTFRLPFDEFLANQRYPGIYLQLYTKNLLMGRSQLGWCLIPAADIVGRFSPVGSVRFLSYRLRDRDGSRGHGVVNVAVKVEGANGIVSPLGLLTSNVPYLQEMRERHDSVMGFPVKS